jgi:hypothetical protein
MQRRKCDEIRQSRGAPVPAGLIRSVEVAMCSPTEGRIDGNVPGI